MTHPPEAIEAVARALWAGDAHYGESWDFVEEPFKDFRRAQATALLDQIAPHYLDTPDDIEIYRIIKRSKARKHGAIAQAIAAAVRTGE